MLKIKASSVIAHCIVWGVFLSLPLLFISGQPESISFSSLFLSKEYFLFFLIYIVVFYFNTYFLVPRLYLRNRFVTYFAIVLTLLLIISFVKPFDNLLSITHKPPFPQKQDKVQALHPVFKPGMPPPQLPGNHPPRRIDAISIFLFVMVIGVGTAISIAQQWRETEQRAIHAEADKANAELSFLKAQINPHFLFNTLNNIYSLAVTKHEYTAACIMKLSNIMRYVTDEAAEHYVPLQDEINCINDYIGLQRIRFGDKLNINIEVRGDAGQKKIAPLILMTFVENIFKYGISKHDPSGIEISLHAEEKEITFYCKNKIFPAASTEDREGVGIGNAKKRLAYLYPDKYLLDIGNDNGYYIVHLTLQV
ncbi:MAG TPA: histidine kinase [Puia sp.]|nr:histidine kinase [Puia sp.]